MQGPYPRKKSKAQTQLLQSQKLNNIDIIYFVAWPKEMYTGTAAASQLLQPSKDQKCQQLGEGQAEETSS